MVISLMFRIDFQFKKLSIDQDALSIELSRCEPIVPNLYSMRIAMKYNMLVGIKTFIQFIKDNWLIRNL